jgi:hypothetical protein
MHVLVGPHFLPCAHKPLTTSRAPSVMITLGSLLIYNCHIVEIILSQIQMFSGFRFHFFSGVEIYWQLLNLKTIFIGYFVRHTSILYICGIRLSPLLLMVVTKRYLGLALFWGYLRAVHRLRASTSHVDGVDVLGMLELLYSLTRVDDAVCLDVCFLTG